MQKNFSPVGKLVVSFKSNKNLLVIGRDGVATAVEISFDEEKAEVDSSVTIQCYEIERGLVMHTTLNMPPLIKYEFEDLFTFQENIRYKKSNQNDLIKAPETWEFSG
jgi:hypothetical protein